MHLSLFTRRTLITQSVSRRDRIRQLFLKNSTLFTIVLSILTSRKPENMTFRNVSSYDLQKYQQPKSRKYRFEMLAIIISRTVGKYIFQKYWQLSFQEILAIIFVRDICQKYWRHMLTISCSKRRRKLTITFSFILAILFSGSVDNYNLPKS